jgi:hypothetical protein
MVINPSFEDHYSCFSQLVENATGWSNPLNTSPNYFNSCNPNASASTPSNGLGFQFAHTGNAYMHIATYGQVPNEPLSKNFREYIQGTLTSTLVSGKEYYIRFYVSLTDSQNFCNNDIGVCFLSNPISISCPSVPCVLPFTPQFENLSSNSLCDRNKWTEISGKYIASGFEKYFIIGNFKDSLSTTAFFLPVSTFPVRYFASYYIDDVLISPLDSVLNVVEEGPLEINANYSMSCINITTSEIINSHVFIYNSIGQLIESRTIQDKFTKINLDEYPFGFYFLMLPLANSIYTLKFFKP